jgi:molecular chaperone DnaK (HSP70)
VLNEDKRYIVGIDLGTTNSAVSYVDLQAQGSQARKIQLFPVPQMTGAGEVTRLSVLPSFLYIPGEYDIPKESLNTEWCTAEGNFAGAFARDHGAKVPARLVASAKSWLCHANADRQAPILPYGAGEEIRKVSPVTATAAYLNHIRKAWNRSNTDDAFHLEHQLVIITVPASFDEVARELTVQAATAAGLKEVILLEEPLAAFYSWLMKHEKTWRDHVAPGELILVCDVGGGTTDFTLIYLRDVDGHPRFERIAVGDHLILGGDNIDLALARSIESQFPPNALSMGGDRWKSLCHQCRQAKEHLLDGSAESHKITLMGSGSQLIAGTLTANLDSQSAAQVVLDGFFPLSDPSPKTSGSLRQGIMEFGLPYEPEPAVTRHIGWFLDRHRAEVETLLDKPVPNPDCILFNGGSLKPGIIQDRIRQAIGHWFGPSLDIKAEKEQEQEASQPRVLDNPDPDLAVALGAAYYGLVKLGQGVRVGSGSPRAYYLGIAPSEADQVQEVSRAICVVERGLEEGTDIQLHGHQFDVLANQPVSFDIFSSSYRSGDRCGDLITIDDTLTPLAPIQTVIQFGKKGVQTRLPVEIAAGYTEMGVLSLWCQSMTSPHRWQLQFQLRSQAGPVEVADQEVFDTQVVEAAADLVRQTFTHQGNTNALKTLTKDLAAHVERPRDQWPLTFIRNLADTLIDLSRERAHSPMHEVRWLNLLGYCLRPGMGDGLDPQRIKKLWAVYMQGLNHPGHTQAQSEWWILWRRVAAGLAAGQQRQFLQDVTPLLFHGKKAPKKTAPQQRLEIWMALANMEHLHLKDKLKCGRQLLGEIKPKTATPQHFWSLGRFGARELLYSSVDRVIAAKQVVPWINTLLIFKSAQPKAVGAALVQLARKTGDMTRDVETSVVEAIVDWISGQSYARKQRDVHLDALTRVVPVARQEQGAIFGESLPAGIVLRS